MKSEIDNFIGVFDFDILLISIAAFRNMKVHFIKYNIKSYFYANNIDVYTNATSFGKLVQRNLGTDNYNAT